MNVENSMRGEDGRWKNVNAFREPAIQFTKYGYYCADPWGTPAWVDHWTEERNRCIHGLTVEGHSISGDHYFYLNYCPINKIDVKNIVGKKAKKILGFPDFWDGDYEYFWFREIARNGILEAAKYSIEEQQRIFELPEEEKLQIYSDVLDTFKFRMKPVLSCENLEGGKDLILGKARRRGFSYKNASVAVNSYFTRPNMYNLLMAYEKKYLFPGIKTIFGKCQSYINFVNDNTGWLSPSDVINKQDHKKNSYYEYKNGIQVEKGFKSEIEAVSFKDNPDAGRGSDTYDIIGEEVGAWGVPGGLKDTVAAMRSSAEAGGFKTGMMTLFGTSGDIEGGTADFADLFGRPGANNFMEFYDIWGKYPKKIEGFFFPKHVNTEGFYDANGNSDLEGAKFQEQEVRKKLIAKGATTTEILKRMQEEPLDSAEAFSMVSVNNFPVVELNHQLEKVKANGWQKSKGTPVRFRYEGREVVSTPILDGSVEPITSYYNLPKSLKGCPVIYEHPIPDAPRGLYKIGYDPIDQESGTSLAAICVYKGVHIGSVYHSILVAEYIGRFEDPDDIDRMAEFFADFYNTTIMHENMVTGVKNYFRRIKRLSLLAIQPDAVISKNVKVSKVARVYGCHMNVQLKDAGERYVKIWLLSILDYDENGDPIRVIDRIYSIRLLEELIAYNRKGNFDLVSSLFMCMFQVQEESLGKEYSEKKTNKNAKMLLSMMESMYK